MAKIIAIANQKGGTGKTTTAMNLGIYLAVLGKKVLLADLDPQGNATGGVGIKPENLAVHIYHALFEKVPARDVMRSAGFFGYDLLPAAPDLAGATVELVDLPEREFKLKNLLHNLAADYDYIIIDCPPSLGLLTINGLVAADEVLIPVQCEFFSIQGLNQLQDTINLIRDNIGTKLDILGALITLYDRRNVSARNIAKDLRRSFEGRVFDTVIPRSVALADAPGRGQTIYHAAPDSPGATAYKQLAQEILNIHGGILNDNEEKDLEEDISEE
ncbi:MAG: hypothetical protein A3A80_01850 [Candidatus Terrybacteria bacterium RIFCSPLOWO2_01_FULL_44_24]|uniref:AAA domain-containing protein n=1 Tax=Candidatus Terrybacteria bacterium RIFCSPHIGHO2_01_FULL_43_35 TaxID=1802361 RepID=A0A1G2PG37_9BACT|nr:MAG: hypothetical protein A2828_01640 [Candidatus Terrybacteria bacterium RIFCSPHIGHO2_01_FULL_43_35]OHA50828.1 MAG: hypothetical protein A3A80_01850 [Candidatus Terrybacteria bacterium RIFCSPLOWO2_01_FULL_44_24]